MEQEKAAVAAATELCVREEGIARHADAAFATGRDLSLHKDGLAERKGVTMAAKGEIALCEDALERKEADAAARQDKMAAQETGPLCHLNLSPFALSVSAMAFGGAPCRAKRRQFTSVWAPQSAVLRHCKGGGEGSEDDLGAFAALHRGAISNDATTAPFTMTI